MKRPAEPSSPAATDPDRGASLYERVLFFVLLTLTAGRPLISESFERMELPFLAALGVGVGTTPAATAWLDALALVAGCAVLARGWGSWSGGRWVAAGVALLAVAVGLSVAAANDKRLALNAGSSLLVGVLVGAALSQLMRAPWMPRLLLAALLASGCATAGKCVLWRVYELDSTVEYWEEHKPTLIEQGMDPDDPTVINFERRLRSGEANGYQAHPNVTGGFLTIWLLGALGLLTGWLATRDPVPTGERAAAVILSGAMCLLSAVALWLTGSTGAMVASAFGVLILAVLGRRRRRIARRPALTTSILAAGYLVVVMAAMGFGMWRGTLPHPSLEFRWYYWTAGAEVFREAPLTGIGRLNFGDAYLRHKVAESTEEVRDPHNLWLTLLVELGPLGLLGGVVLSAGIVRGALRRLEPEAACDQPPVCRAKHGTGREGRISRGQMMVAAAGVLLLHAIFSPVILDGPTALLWAVELAGLWSLALVLAARLIDRLATGGDGLSWLLAGLAAALLASLVHGLVDFALLTPGGLSLFAGVAAAVFALRREPGGSGLRAAPVSVALAGLVLVGAQVVLVALPTMRTSFWLLRMKATRFDVSDPRARQRALACGRQALAADPLDAAAAREAAAFAWALGSSFPLPAEERLALLREAEAFGQAALRRNPHSCAAHVRLARIYESIEEACLAAARADESVEALHNAVTHWQQAVSLYPTDPRKRIAAGQIWVQWWRETGDPQAARTALEHFAAALQIDSRRKPEEVQRLRVGELAVIEHYRGELARAGFSDDLPNAEPTP